MRTFVIVDEDPEQMSFAWLGGVRVYRPRAAIEFAVRQEAEAHLRVAYRPGRYSDKATVNAILRHQFQFFESVLQETLPGIASRHAMEFLLHEYDQWSRIEVLSKRQKLDAEDVLRWNNLGPIHRRAIKYLAERVTLLAPAEAPRVSEDRLLDALDRAFIAAEELIELSLLSNQTYLLFPDDTWLDIASPGAPTYVTLELANRDVKELPRRIQADTQHRRTFLTGPAFHDDTSLNRRFFDSAFQATLGVDYEGLFKVLDLLMHGVGPPPTGFPVPFAHRDRCVEAVAGTSGLKIDVVDKIVSGFVLTQANMQAEDRQVWKPKQEYRALRRGLFQLPHPDGPHLTWSPSMARECKVLLKMFMAFRHLPPEWQSEQMTTALTEYAQHLGHMFEQATATNWTKLGFLGARSYKDRIGVGSARIAIPPDVGEIDCLAYHPREHTLGVAECKMIRPGIDPVFMRDDQSKFLKPIDGYADRFRRKIEWISQNVLGICVAMASMPEFRDAGPVNPKHLRPVLLTYYPSVVTHLIHDFPCVALSEFMLEYLRQNVWPYRVGTRSI